MNTFILNSVAREHMIRAIDTAGACVDTLTPSGVIQTGWLATTLVPADSPLWALRNLPFNDAVLIDGLPVQENEHPAFVAVVSTCLMSLMRRGVPWNWISQGPVFQQVAPKFGAAANTNASAEDFGPHMDDAACRELAPETITLTGMVNVANAETGWVSARDILKGMPSAFFRDARSSNYELRVPLSLGLGDLWVGPVPLFHASRSGNDYEARFASYAVRPIDPHSKLSVAVIEWLREAAIERMEWIEIQPGQMFIFPNHLGLHARKRIAGDRSILRSYWNTKLSRHRELGGVPDQPWCFDAYRVLQALWPFNKTIHSDPVTMANSPMIGVPMKGLS